MNHSVSGHAAPASPPRSVKMPSSTLIRPHVLGSNLRLNNLHPLPLRNSLRSPTINLPNRLNSRLLPLPSSLSLPPPMNQTIKPPANLHSPSVTASLKRLSGLVEQSFLLLGSLAESLGEPERATAIYEYTLKSSPFSANVLVQLGNAYRVRESYDQAIQCLSQALDSGDCACSGDIYGLIGHCYLMKDDNRRAYENYQKAISLISSPSDPKLWYGIGILYDRLHAFEQAEVAFNTALTSAGLPVCSEDARLDDFCTENDADPELSRRNSTSLPDLAALSSLAAAASSTTLKHFEKASEVYFRLGVIYKNLGKLENSLSCFRRVLYSPPSPLTTHDIQYQMGYCFELKNDVEKAREIYEYILSVDPNHARTLQQLGWLLHSRSAAAKSAFPPESPANNLTAEDEKAEEFLCRAVKADPTDAYSHYLLGRCHMAHGRYTKAHDAYQQAVYREPRNPTFWCSIGVLYFSIRQYRDALEAYSRAIRLNPNIAETWYDLGTLYETCQNQLPDALDAYERAAALEPDNVNVRNRIRLVKDALERTQNSREKFSRQKRNVDEELPKLPKRSRLSIDERSSIPCDSVEFLDDKVFNRPYPDSDEVPMPEDDNKKISRHESADE